jgi:transposase
VDESYVGQQVVGLDLHRRRTVMVRMTPAGEQLEAVRFVSDPVVLAEQIAKAGPSPEVVVEATYNWYWVADVLDEAGARLHLAHPLGVKGFAYRRVKDDFRDAADLADLLRMGRLPEAWIAPKHVRCQRELVRHRHKLRQLCSGLKAGAHAVLAKNALLIPRWDMFGVDGRHRLRRLALPEAYRVRLDSQLHLIDAFEAEIEDLDGRIRGLFDADAGYRALLRVPGIGPVFAAILRAEIGEIAPVPLATPAQLVGRVDPASSRVRYHRASWRDHQARFTAGALGRGGGRAAHPCPNPDACPLPAGGHPARGYRQARGQGRRRPRAARLRVLRPTRWTRTPPGTHRRGMTHVPTTPVGARPCSVWAPRRAR